MAIKYYKPSELAIMGKEKCINKLVGYTSDASTYRVVKLLNKEERLVEINKIFSDEGYVNKVKLIQREDGLCCMCVKEE